MAVVGGARCVGVGVAAQGVSLVEWGGWWRWSVWDGVAEGTVVVAAIRVHQMDGVGGHVGDGWRGLEAVCRPKAGLKDSQDQESLLCMA